MKQPSLPDLRNASPSRIASRLSTLGSLQTDSCEAKSSPSRAAGKVPARVSLHQHRSTRYSQQTPNNRNPWHSSTRQNLISKSGSALLKSFTSTLTISAWKKTAIPGDSACELQTAKGRPTYYVFPFSKPREYTVHHYLVTKEGEACGNTLRKCYTRKWRARPSMPRGSPST